MGLFDFFSNRTTIPANPDEWIILVSHKIKRTEHYCWDSDAPIVVEFVPIFAWERSSSILIPISPPNYYVTERLNANPLDNKVKYETFGFCNRDGVMLDISDMSHSDFWNDMFDYASDGREIEIRGSMPDSFRSKFKEIFDEMDRQRRERENKV